MQYEHFKIILEIINDVKCTFTKQNIQNHLYPFFQKKRTHTHEIYI